MPQNSESDDASMSMSPLEKLRDVVSKGIAIDILNLAGEIIHINEMTSNQNTKKIDVSGFDSGVYLIKLRSETEVVIEKIVIRQ